MKHPILATALVAVGFALCASTFAAQPQNANPDGAPTAAAVKKTKKVAVKKHKSAVVRGASVAESDKPDHSVKPGPKPKKSMAKGPAGSAMQGDPPPEKKDPAPKPPKAQGALAVNPAAVQVAPGQGKP